MKTYRLAMYSNLAVMVARGGQSEVSSKVWANIFQLLRIRQAPRELLMDIILSGHDRFNNEKDFWECIYYSDRKNVIENYSRFPTPEMLTGTEK